MAEKECLSYEAMAGADNNGTSQQQKRTATTIQLPSLTSKPLKHQQAVKDNSNQNELPPSGYYLNVAQKGKLILPTALWILLIVAGVSFLTLLASLNRTVDTLDTLIVMERDMDADDMVHHLRDHTDGHHGLQRKKEEDEYRESSKARHASKKEREWHNSHELDRVTAAELNEDNDDRWFSGVAPMKTSWFTFPSWTSLKPDSQTKFSSHSHHNHQSASGSTEESDPLTPPQISSIMSDMIRQVMGPAEQQGSAPEITGSFIIPSTLDDGGDLQVSGGGTANRPPTGLFDSIFRQIMPMLDDSKDDQNEPKTVQKSAQREETQSPVPIITANIENLNINLNTGNNDASKGSKPDTKKTTITKKPAHYEREEMDTLEKSIDSMMSNMIEQKSTDTDPIFVNMGADELMSLVEPMDLIKMHNKAKHQHHRHDARPSEEQKNKHTSSLSPLSPLSSILMPIGFGSPMPFQSSEVSAQADLPFMPSSLFQSYERPTPSVHDNDNKQHRYQHGRPSMAKWPLDESRQNQLPEGAQVVISISSDEKQTDKRTDRWPDLTGGIMSGLGDILRGSESVSQAAPGQSPYELPIGSPISSLLDSLKDFDQTIVTTATGKHEDHLSKKPLDQAQRLKEEAKWDRLAKDLAESIMESTLQGQPIGGDKGLGQMDQPQSILMMKDGKPLAESERQNLPVSIMFIETTISDSKNTSEAEPSTKSTKDSPKSPEFSLSENSTSSTQSSKSDLENRTDKSNMDNSNKTGGDQDLATLIRPGSPLSELLTSSFKVRSEMPTKGIAVEITETPTIRDSKESFLNDFTGNMFAMPQFESNIGGSSSQQQVGISDRSNSSSPGGSSSSVFIETITPVSIDSQLFTTKTLSSSSVETSTSTEASVPNSSNETAYIAGPTTKPESLPDDPLLKGFLGVTGDEPFFTKEDVNIPTTSVAPAITGQKITDQSSSNVPTTTKPVPVNLTTTAVVIAEKSAQTSATPQLNSTKTPFAEVIREDEAPLNMPMIDLAPFAKSSPPIEDESKQKVVAATKIDDVKSTPPLLTSTTWASSPATSRPVIDKANTTANVASVTTQPMATDSTGTVPASKTTTVMQPKSNHETGKPLRSFLEKADEFLGRNLFNFRRLF